MSTEHIGEQNPQIILDCGDDLLAKGSADIARRNYQRIRLDFSYDGAPFSGWAAQPGRVTVQGILENALELILRKPVRLTVAGRTDAGVHAQHQSAHLDIELSRWEAMRGRDGQGTPEEIMARKLRGALKRSLALAEEDLGLPAPLRGSLQGAIVLYSVSAVPADFDARFSATGRSYIYRIYDGSHAGADPLYRGFSWGIGEKLDIEDLNRISASLLGLHDFLSFCKPREDATTVRELREVRWEREGQLVTVHISADAFCHHMVRSLVGALVRYGTGQKDEAWLLERLEKPARDSSVLLAPAQGLSLSAIHYPAQEEYAAQASRTRRKRSLEQA
ncbi:MAG: tRNA pseudouridine(38-40) synthase TruA [Rothia sp. (in: high G+C Gram-positive bacteria)]|uniref:tRNA pseudouridine(38-40) synthase TruA n=1 Tax=Rothia sp. (in: high G+C Gram-positive bacteria) TaxID=1885016 RepID=UPI0026DEA900|nr:tRNA pseudouridine(38-40) synthase TruA [Rothia sp. (in: high G+C Gram-positive bacteria)]MDO5749981.1 tRNA pseudouridine(38-40) synthase TruA [Rothia sp. (in: high G+C Gram-positive bacteria)]